MRRLLSTGIKAILAIAALSTAAHWALRVGGDAPPAPSGMAAIPDPVTTGSITPRKVERASPVAAPVQVPGAPAAKLDQQHLLKLFTDAAPERKAPKAVAKR